MDKSRWFLIIFLIYLLGFFSHALYLGKTVYGDGIFYYSWLRSAVVDRDINFRDEYAIFRVNEPTTVTGLPANKYAVGPAILWWPAFVWTDLLIRGAGFELPYQLAVGLTSCLYAIFGLVLLYRLLTKFFNDEVSKLSVLSIALATNFFFYGSLDTVNSHALSFFSVSLFLSFLLASKKNWFLIGLSLGLIGLVRSQDLVFGLLILPFLKLPSLPKLGLGALVGFLPQLIAWQALYGHFWMSPYLAGGEKFDFLHPHILEVLFAPWYGLFFFSPILLVGLVGLFFWKNQLKLSCLLAILLELLIISSWSIYWQGASVGGRMFISSFPLLALGMASVFTKLIKRSFKPIYLLLTLIAPLSALNFVLTFSYLVLH